MEKMWKNVIGVIVLVVGAILAWQGYSGVQHCASLGGQISTFFSSLFGGNGAQTCYNANVLQWAGVLIAIIGLVVLYVANMKMSKKSKKGRK